MARSVPGELIPVPLSWLGPGITLCCKSLKAPGDKFPARRRNKPRLLIDLASDALPKSPVSLSSGDEVPHMFTRKPRLQLEKSEINGAKRLLQQNLPGAVISRSPLSDNCCREAAASLASRGPAMPVRRYRTTYATDPCRISLSVFSDAPGDIAVIVERGGGSPRGGRRSRVLCLP
jgi:hypothetical protein